MAEHMFQEQPSLNPEIEDVVNKKLPEQVKKEVISEDSDSFGMPLSEELKNLKLWKKDAAGNILKDEQGNPEREKMVNDKDDRHEALTGKRYL